MLSAPYGWGEAGALVAGDAIRDKDLQPLTVLAVEVDTTPQMVHNLEIAEAHTYFAGELEAWGHNYRWWKPGGPGKRLRPYDTKTGQYVCKIRPLRKATLLAAGAVFGYSDGQGLKPINSPLKDNFSRVGYGCGYSFGAGKRLLGFAKYLYKGLGG